MQIPLTYNPVKGVGNDAKRILSRSVYSLTGLGSVRLNGRTFILFHTIQQQKAGDNMKKWLSGFISLILAVTLLMGGLPLSASAAEVQNADTGAQTYTDGDYTYTVLSSGSAEIVKYNSTEAQVTIPSTLGGKEVASIGNDAFSRNAYIESVTIPEGVGRIGNYGFANCANLRSITVSAETVGWQAFTNCDSLTDITLNSTVKTIERGAFSDCGALKSITIPDSVTQIDPYMASDCPSLTSFSIGSGV